jgi:hypothetical protein
MKTDIIKILNKRAEHFEKIHHSFEAREIKSAIDTIERLMPPELFSIPVVVVPKGTLVCEHRWIHNTHTDTKYCSKGCDGFKIQESN